MGDSQKADITCVLQRAFHRTKMRITCDGPTRGRKEGLASFIDYVSETAAATPSLGRADADGRGGQSAYKMPCRGKARLPPSLLAHSLAKSPIKEALRKEPECMESLVPKKIPSPSIDSHLLHKVIKWGGIWVGGQQFQLFSRLHLHTLATPNVLTPALMALNQP